MRLPIWLPLSLLSLSLSLAGCRKSPPPASNTAVEVSSPPGTTISDGGTASPAPAVAVTPAAAAAAAAAKPKPAKIRVVVRSAPPKALVSWGKKKLGPTPVIVERPRASGPMDLVVRADGYFPVHTRAYTFHNDTLYVKLTKLADKMTLFGARKELEPSPSPAPTP